MAELGPSTLLQRATSIRPDYPDSVVSLKTAGAWMDGKHDNAEAVRNAVMAALGTAVQVPPGIAALSTLPNDLLGRFAGEGQLRTGDGHIRGRMFARRSTPPRRYGSLDDISTAFDGDLSTVQLAIEHRLDGNSVSARSGAYSYRHENSAVSIYFQNKSGQGAQGARTGCGAITGRVTQEGQGDATFFSVSGTVFGTKAGSSHFLENPAVLIMDGDLFAFADGTYQEVDEFNHHDAGFDVAVSSTVRNFNRTNNKGDKGVWWVAARYQSFGTKPVDAAVQVVGKWKTVVDTTNADLGTAKAAITMAAGHRIYLNSVNTDSFANPAAIRPGPDYLSVNPASGKIELVSNETPVLVASAEGIEANVLRRVSSYYQDAGPISPTDRMAVIDSDGLVHMTLGAGPADGHEMVIKRLGDGGAVVTLHLDRRAGSEVVMDGWTAMESVTLSWSAQLRTWLLIGLIASNGALPAVRYGRRTIPGAGV